jgi:polysaccharide deacetylase family protein (PEP-CTERM system associated)
MRSDRTAVRCLFMSRFLPTAHCRRQLNCSPTQGRYRKCGSVPGEEMNFTNVISVDVEDYFQAEAFADVVDRSLWGSYPSRVEANTKRLLGLFAEHQIEATFFVLGWVAERFPGLVAAIAAAGHEIACHSYWHRMIFKLQPREFREDTRRAKDVVEQAAGCRVEGYRAPTYSIVADSLWALDILAELEFTYDSSIFPIHHDTYGIPHAPRFPFRISTAGGELVEYPISTFRLGGSRNWPVGGGGYLRILPWWYTRLGVERAQKEGLPLIAYVHPWEIDPDQPRIAGRLRSRFRHYMNLSRTYGRLDRMLREHSFTSFRRSGLDQAEPETTLPTLSLRLP